MPWHSRKPATNASLFELHCEWFANTFNRWDFEFFFEFNFGVGDGVGCRNQPRMKPSCVHTLYTKYLFVSWWPKYMRLKIEKKQTMFVFDYQFSNVARRKEESSLSTSTCLKIAMANYRPDFLFWVLTSEWIIGRSFSSNGYGTMRTFETDAEEKLTWGLMRMPHLEP